MASHVLLTHTTLPVPSHCAQLTADQAGAVIGKGGATIQDIRTRTGANVKIVSRNRQQFAIVEAADSKAGQAAETEVRRVIASSATTSGGGRVERQERSPRAPRERAAHEPGAPHKSFALPDPTMTVVLVGPRGATVRALEEETGATIEVERDSGRVTISGSTQSIVDNASARVQATVSGIVKCTSGAGCGGWAKKGELFCPRCSRAREGGEAADDANLEARRAQREGHRSREKAVSRARDNKTAGRDY